MIDILSDKDFYFNNGEANLRLLIQGNISKPIANGFLVLNNAEVELFSSNFSDVNGTLLFDFDQLEIKELNAKGNNSGGISAKGSLPFYKRLEKEENSINFISDQFIFIKDNINLTINSDINISGSFSNPSITGNIGFNNGYINFKDKNNNNENELNIKKEKVDYQKIWPELQWKKDSEIEIISNESILSANLFGRNLPNFLDKLSFKNLKIKLGPNFRLQYSNILEAHLDTKLDLNINGTFSQNINARGLVYIKKGKANLYTTPFKLDKTKENYILFASRNGIVPYINFSFNSKVPDAIIPITENYKDTNISTGLSAFDNTNNFGSFGIGNTRFIKIEASYKGFLDQLSFEDENQKIQLRSTPSYSRSQIIGLIGGNSANLINRAFISQLNGSNGFSERFQLSLYPAIIETYQPNKSIFSKETLDLNQNPETSSKDGDSSQAWVAEVGLDITNRINFAVQTTPDRDEIPTLGILTLQANPNLELLGSFDANGNWKSQVQLFFRY